MSYARRTDANHSVVIEALRRCGWFVLDCSRVGHGFFDAIVCRRGRVVFAEIKDGTKPASRQRLTASEGAMHEDFRRAGAEVVILRSVEEAIRL